MACLELQISDPAQRITLEMMLRNAGHRIGGNADLLITDNARQAAEMATRLPVLVLTTAAGIPEAIKAMKAGAYGYIFLPLQPGEAPLMVERALKRMDSPPSGNASPQLPDALAVMERQHIETILKACGGNQAEAARRLGIGRNTLWRKLRSAYPDAPQP